MGDSLSVRFSKIFQTTNEESWIVRVKQNARAFFELRGAALAHGGPGAFDLIEGRPAPGTRQRQAGSLIVHAVVIGIVVWLGGRVVKNGPDIAKLIPIPGHVVYPGEPLRIQEEKPGSGAGSGAHQDALPPNAGDFARRSLTVLLHPRVPDQQEHALPVEPTIFGAEELKRKAELGLPWMKERTNSNGPGPGDGIGDTPGNTMGTSETDGTGRSDKDGNYEIGRASCRERV